MDRFSTLMAGLAAPTEFYFVRHGESEGNTEGRMQGHLDRHLTDRGRRQAEETGDWFAEMEIEIGTVVSSPLLRAIETARIISDRAGYPEPREIESARELDTGVFTNLSIREIKEAYPAEYRRFIIDSWEAVPEAESVSSLSERALETWGAMAAIANGSGGGAVLTVTHGGMMQWIVKTSFGATPDHPVPWMPLVLASNCSVFQFSARPIQGIDSDGGERHWYYGQWSLMNHTPTEDARTIAGGRDQFHTDDAPERSQVR